MARRPRACESGCVGRSSHATHVVRGVLVAAAVAWIGIGACLAAEAGDAGDDRKTVATALASASLDDSKGHRWNLAEIASHPVLLLLAGRKGSDQAAAWGEGIHRRHPDGLALWATPSDPLAVVIVSDADLHEVPGVLHGIVRWRIASVIADREREGKAGPPLLLDWEGVLPRAVGADTSGDAVVVLLDRDRAERARFSGEPTEATLGALATAIDALRSADAPAKAAAPPKADPAVKTETPPKAHAPANTETPPAADAAAKTAPPAKADAP